MTSWKIAPTMNAGFRMLNVIDVLPDLFILHGVPGHVRSDNGPEFVATAVRGWISAVGAKTAFIEPGSPLQVCDGSIRSIGHRPTL